MYSVAAADGRMRCNSRTCTLPMHNVILNPMAARHRPNSMLRAIRRSLGGVTCACLLAATLVAGENTPPTPPSPPPESSPAVTDTAAAHEAEIARLLRQIFDERTELAAMRKEHAARIEESRNTEFALTRSIAAWETDLAAAQAEFAAEREQREALESEFAARRAVIERWRRRLAQYPPVLARHVDTGIDFDRAGRRTGAQELAAAAAQSDIAPADLWQRISRAQEAEEGLARTLELATVRVAADREVDGLRLGLAMLTAPTADGGALIVAPGERPQAESTAPTGQGAGLTAALQILQRRRSPEFSDVYLPALAAPAAAEPAPPIPQSMPTPPNLPAPPVITKAEIPSAIAPMALPADPATAANQTAGDVMQRLDAGLTQIRQAKAAFATAAAQEYQAHQDRIGRLESIESERAQQLKSLQAALTAERNAIAGARDQLLLTQERQAVFTAALQASRDQLLERLTGSLEAAAQPAIAAGLQALRQPRVAPAPAAPPVPVDGAMGADAAVGQRLEDATIENLMSAQLQIYSALLAAARSGAEFEMPVRLDDGRVIQARCLQPSLLPGYFADPATRSAGLLLADSREQGAWRGQVKGLSSAEQQAIAARLIDHSDAGILPVDVSGGAAAIQASHQWNLLDWFEAGGKVMWPLLVVALAGLVLVLERAAALLRLQGRTRDLLARVESALQQGRYEEAQRLCDPNRGPVQRVLHAALSHRHGTRAAIEDAIQVTALGELPHLQKGLGMLALLAGLAPLLGLLGTVTGMINTFQMVNLFGSSDTRFLAGGISEALITTEFGLVIAIPLVFAHGILGRLSERILAAIELGAAIVMQRLGNLPSVSGVQSAAPTTEPGAAPATDAPAPRKDTVLVIPNATPGGGT